MGTLSIGILAHNESGIIGRTIASLANQSILIPSHAASVGIRDIEVVVVPNGCTDDTDTVSAEALAKLPGHVATSVHSLSEAGKSNAWNTFVHTIARAETSMFVLMDADIEFASGDVLEHLVRQLDQSPTAKVTTDRAVKKFADGARLGPLERLSRRVSAQQGGQVGICGQLYCARADALRQIWLPYGLPVEDGFLAAMLVTNGFTEEPDDSAIVSVAGAAHFYEPVTSVTGFVRHEARIIVGSVINAWLFTLLWEAGKQGHTGAFVQRRNADDPRWVEAICAQEKARHGRWLIPGTFMTWRFAPLRHQSLSGMVRRAPIALAATLATLPALVRANTILRRTGASRHW